MDTLDFLLKLGISMAIGGLIGLEREQHSDHELVIAGVRTYPLISLAGFLFAFLEMDGHIASAVPLGLGIFGAVSLAYLFIRHSMRLTGFTRQETAEYPLGVVREAIVNAVAHRDYAIRGDDIRVLMFSDHMEVYSPGRLPGHVTLDNLVTERFSRNEAIAQVLSDLGFVERLGYGIVPVSALIAHAR